MLPTGRSPSGEATGAAVVTAPSLRRRVDSSLLRWQARLDAPTTDRFLPWVVAAALSTVLALLALARARSLEADVQLAESLQAMWLLREGAGTAVTLADGHHVLAPHLSLLLWPIAQLTRALPAQTTLLVVQAVALGSAVVPLWRLARRVANLRAGAACTLLAAYALYPAVHGVNLSGFHVEAVALPLLLVAALAGLTERHVVLGLACGAVVLARADLGLAVAGLGLVLVLNGRRRGGAAALVGGLVWTAVAAFVVQPWLDGSNVHLEAFSGYGDSAAAVVWGALTRPGDVLADAASETNLDLVILLLGPLLFLPVLVPRFLAGVVPIAVVTFVATAPTDPLWSGRTVPITALLFLSTTFALHRLGREGVERVIVDRRLLTALVLASVMFFIQSGTSSPYRKPWDWGGRDVTDQVRLAVPDAVAPNDRVRTSPSVAQVLAERAEVTLLEPGERPDPAAAVADVDVVVVDEAQLASWTSLERRLLLEGIEARGFEIVLEGEGIVVLRRGGAVAGDAP